ncbi:MAG: undecaprenyldiphospho-muramoylpentapeptide beta-N-acetylglucosaminyltransferase [Streptococcaceae bacterium]|nr:undecaprenyldiphospho-muramoylpentapeptide beta-N-acetylglucosaminyltransferase [Streptococcaceae bacterium]
MKILVTGGGTGGHIYPALAFIKYVKKVLPETEFLYVGTGQGLESKIVPKSDVAFKTVKVQGFKRSLSLDNFRTIYLFLKSIRTAKKIMRSFQPDVVIGTGGYVSAPVVFAAAKLNIPTIIHEQNSVVGVTNQFLSRYVDKIAVSFDVALQAFPADKAVLTGNPRAQEVQDIKKTEALLAYGLSDNQPTVVIFGGSRGALKINQAVVEAIPLFDKANYQVLYASGERYYQEFQAAFNQANQLKNVKIVPYIDNMLEVLASSSLLVGRAGATTIAEFTSLGLPAILIPSPYVTADHQTKNAQSLVDIGAVEMIKDSDLTGERLAEKIQAIFSDETLYQRMSQASLNAGEPVASEKLFNIVEELV